MGLCGNDGTVAETVCAWKEAMSSEEEMAETGLGGSVMGDIFPLPKSGLRSSRQ